MKGLYVIGRNDEMMAVTCGKSVAFRDVLVVRHGCSDKSILSADRIHLIAAVHDSRALARTSVKRRSELQYHRL